MRSHQSSSHAFFLWAFIVPCGLTFLASPSLVFAEDQTNEPSGKAQRKQQLERQLKSILDELDELKQGDRPAPVQPLPVQPEPQAMTEPQIEQGPAPEISLEDMSIISRRLQKHPEGVTLTSTPQSEMTRSRPGTCANRWSRCRVSLSGRRMVPETSAFRFADLVSKNHRLPYEISKSMRTASVRHNRTDSLGWICTIPGLCEASRCRPAPHHPCTQLCPRWNGAFQNAAGQRHQWGGSFLERRFLRLSEVCICRGTGIHQC